LGSGGFLVNLNLQDKVFVVSGSSRGIGRGVARVLLGEGATVALTARGKEELESARLDLDKEYPGQVRAYAADVADPGEVAKLADWTLREFGRVDGLAANAGAVKPVPAWDISEDDWDWYFRANFFTAERFIRVFVPALQESRGAVVIISSIAGLEDIGAPIPYNTAKAASVMLSKSLAQRLAAESVRVNTIAPGNVLFPGGNWERKRQADPEGVDAMIQRTVPLNRFGTPEEIGAACAFLLSDRSSFTTGACLAVDGGQTARFL
jgi:3-oxoacyl-[acyl-carrier protein] reductase